MKNLILLLLLFSCATQVKKPETSLPSQPTKEVVMPSKKVYFKTKSTLPWMRKIVEKANCVNNNKDFLKEIASIKSFYFSNHNGNQVAANLKSSKLAYLNTYRTRNPWSKVNGYRDVNTGLIYFNTRRNPRSIEEMVDTAIHERSHHWYNHNGNKATGLNLKSVPYEVGRRARKYVKRCP